MALYSNPYEPITTLVIDVNSSMRQIIASMLRNLGFKNIFVATNQIQAYEILKVESIDLVFCGWQDGKLDGLKVLERVRDNPKTKSVPFIMVTDMIDQDLVRQAVQSGVSEYIVPPFNKKILQKRLERALKIPIHSSASNVIKRDTRTRFKNKGSTKDLNILIVDDIPDNIEVIRGILKPHFKIRAVTNGKSVMQICLSDQPPDIILLDIMMPEVDGLTVCKQLKQNPMTQNIVIIFLSALAEADDVVRGLELGAVDYITKPIQPDVVLARVNTHSRLVITKRAVQQQIDSMVSLQQRREKLEASYQKQLAFHSKHAIENINYLDSKLKGNNIVGRAFDQLKYSVNMSQIGIDNLLTLQQVEERTYKISRSRKETSNFVKRLIQLFMFEIKEKNIEIKLHLDCDAALFSDEKLLTAIIASLLSNAIKFSPRGSQIPITTKELNHHILISINNINEISPKVVDNFYDLFVTTDTEQGSGIGTFAAFKIARYIGAELYYHSSEKHGTTFYLKVRK